MPLLAGIDGCPTGWLCVVQDLETDELTARILSTIDAILGIQIDLALIDIPIGLTDSGPRKCDLEARKFLGPKRGSSVFAAPLRPMLRAKDYVDACDIGSHIHGKKISKQLWGIMPKIREVDAFLSEDPGRQNWLRETHPECGFAIWNDGNPIIPGKRTPDGAAIRSALIESEFGDAFARLTRTLPRGGFAPDDLRDALAALHSAHRLHRGIARSFPVTPGFDASGLRMEILA